MAPLLLVLRHHGLGDLMTAQPALWALRRHFPAHRMLVSCPDWLLPLAEHLGPADGWVSNRAAAGDPASHMAVDSAICAELERLPVPDVVVSMRTPDLELRPLFARWRPRLLASYSHPELPQTRGWPELDFTDHILARWARLLAPWGIVPEETMLYRAPPPGPGTRATIVHTGAGSIARHWPWQRWAAIAAALEADGQHVVLTGSDSERARITQIRQAAGLPASRDLAGRTSSLALAAMVGEARLVTCVDTGIAHLATSFRTPAVTLFGPVPPAWWGPPASATQHETLWSGVLGDTYADGPDPNLACITVEDVLAACRRVAGSPAGASLGAPS